ncbi:hypothetical protein ACH41H_36150 [Streptomyces sp. NPDC020800]|uniref:hypothetical protein n=1 Tax=Streptomyces sp. NPDC020800 TaxID=3365092 RepID=UPI0037A8A08D
MHLSIPHSTPTPEALAHAEHERTRVQRDDLRDLLKAVRDALDIPPGNRRPALLDSRALLVLGTLNDVLNDRACLGIAWETEIIRQKVREDGGGHA